MDSIDTYLLKIAGKAELPKAISVGHNWRVSSEGSVEEEVKKDNHDGSYTYTYLYKPIKIEVLTELGETLRLKDTRSKSTLFRARLYGIWKTQNITMPWEDYYNVVMDSLIFAGEDVAEMYGPKI